MKHASSKRTLLVSGIRTAEHIGEAWAWKKGYSLTTFQALKELKKDRRFKGYAEGTLKKYASAASRASKCTPWAI